MHCVSVGALKGAVIGGATGAISNMALAAGIHRFTTGSWDGVEDVLLEAGADGYLGGVVEGAVIGGLSSNVCFVAGTVILTNVGKIAIETIEEGMLVWAKNTETGEEGFKEVLKTFATDKPMNSSICLSVAKKSSPPPSIRSM